jgi:hypothetical protein
MYNFCYHHWNSVRRGLGPRLPNAYFSSDLNASDVKCVVGSYFSSFILIR